MQRSTKHALKTKLQDWERRQLEFPTETAYLQGKMAHLEDILYLYQNEIEYLTTRSQKSVDVQDMRRLEDANANMAKQIKVLTDELTANRVEKDKAVQQCSADFQKLLTRTNERQQGQNRVLVQQNDILKAKVANLEAQLQELQTVEQAKVASEVVDLKYKIEDLERKLKEKETEIVSEQSIRTDVEEELSKLQGRFQSMVSYVESLDDISSKVMGFLQTQTKTHRQLVETLLQTGGGATAANAEQELSLAAKNAVTLGTVEGSTPTERLVSAVSKLEASLDTQQVEMAVATRCAMDTFNDSTKELTAKLHQSFAHCELQMARIRDLEIQHGEERDYAFAERDRALALRDQTLLELRAREKKDHKFQNSVEVQTVVRGDFAGLKRGVAAAAPPAATDGN